MRRDHGVCGKSLPPAITDENRQLSTFQSFNCRVLHVFVVSKTSAGLSPVDLPLDARAAPWFHSFLEIFIFDRGPEFKCEQLFFNACKNYRNDVDMSEVPDRIPLTEGRIVAPESTVNIESDGPDKPAITGTAKSNNVRLKCTRDGNHVYSHQLNFLWWYFLSIGN